MKKIKVVLEFEVNGTVSNNDLLILKEEIENILQNKRYSRKVTSTMITTEIVETKIG